MSAPEREHIVAAFSFELGKCLSEEIKDRMLANLANVDATLASGWRPAWVQRRRRGSRPGSRALPGPLAGTGGPAGIEGRVVGLFVGDGVDGAGLGREQSTGTAGAQVVVIAPHGGDRREQGPVEVTKSALTTQSVEYDALVVAGGRRRSSSGPLRAVNLGEAYRHYKTIAAWGQGRRVLKACGIALDAPGVVTIDKPTRRFSASLIEAIGWHRHWTRV